MPKYLQPGAAVLVRFGAEWKLGTVESRKGTYVDVRVGADLIGVHASVIRRDLRKAGR